MKLRTKIIVGFLMIILVPLLLFAATLYGLGEYQAQQHVTEEMSEEPTYDISILDSASRTARVQLMTKDLFFSAFMILVITGLSVGSWIYRSVAGPLVKLKKATHNIKAGNLDFVFDVE